MSEAAGGDGRPHATRKGSTPSSLSVWEPDIGVWLGSRDSSMRCVCPRCVCVCAEVWGRARWWVAEAGVRTSLASRLFGCRPKRRGVGAASHAHPPSCTSSSVDQTSLPPPTLLSRCLLMSPSLQPLAAIMDPPWLRENGGSRAIAQYAPHVGAEWPENRRMRCCEWTATRQPPRMQSVPTPMEGPPGSDDLVDRALVLLRHQFLRGVPQSGPSGSGSVET